MTGMEIVREETRRMLRGMIPLAVIAFGVFLLAGARSGAERRKPAVGDMLFAAAVPDDREKRGQGSTLPAGAGDEDRPARIFFPVSADWCDGVSGNQAAVSPSARSSRSAFLSQNHFTVVHVFQRKGG